MPAHLCGPPDVLIVVIVVGVILSLVAVAIVSEKRRRHAILEAFAAAGFTHTPKPTDDEKAEAFSMLGTMRALRTGPSGVQWIARGDSSGLSVTLVEHVYTTGSGKNRTTHYHAIAAAPCPRSWPRVEISEEHLFDKIAQMFGRGDFNVESEEFNKRFKVKTESDDFALLLLNPEVQAWCLALPRRTAVSIGDGAICVVRKARLSAKEVSEFAGAPAALLGLLPESMEHWA